ncbi:hypothetical protein ACHAPT_010530 [Fusarium lateritium]
MAEQDPNGTSQLGFLPVNQTSSPPASRHRRAYLSCERCRKRKSRCEPLQGETRCRRCVTDNQLCEFRATRSTKRRGSPIEQDVRRRRDDGSGPRNPEAVEFQSFPAENALQSQHTIDMNPSLESPATTATLDARTRLVSTHIHNTADALDLLTFAAAGSQGYNPSDTPAHESHTSVLPSSACGPSIEARRVTSAWSGFVLIRKGVISQQEVIEYLDFFFERLWPLKPVVPAYYRNRTSYVQLAVEEPILLTCLVTIASRYFPLSGSHGEIRSERIHWQTWKFLQRFLQSVMWGSTTTRSLGAISSMILLIDWHVKAINNPMDFTDGEEEAINYIDDSMAGQPSDSLTGQRRYGMTSLMEKLNIVSPSYRSNKMSWILLSNAIALAHEGCCFENEAHAPSTTPSEAIRQEWSRLVCVFIYLADESLATRLGLEPLLPEKSRQVVKDRFSATFADSLPDSTLWEGYLELAAEARKGREFLHSLKKPGVSLPSLNLVPNLEHLRRALSRWRRQYHHHYDSNTFLGACLDMEFHYITMYCFAPAAQALPSSSRTAAGALSEFSDQAAQASCSLLAVVVDVLEPAKLLAYLPVRCWLFIVAASLHLLKATIGNEQHISPSNPNIHLLRSVIDAIRHGSPDDSHMAMRFSKFLGIVLQASLPVPQSLVPEGADQGTENRVASQGEEGTGTTHASIFEDIGIWDVPFSLDVVSDPLTWWDSSGRNGFARFP